MIKHSGISFGFGKAIGTTANWRERNQRISVPDKSGYVLHVSFLPSVSDIVRIAALPGISFCVIPLCSPYSHLGASTWFNDIPTIAVDIPWTLPSNTTVLADFDTGELFIAETDTDVEALSAIYLNTMSNPEFAYTSFKQPFESNISVQILAEVSSANDAMRALSEGADGLGVVNADRLFNSDAINRHQPNELVQVVKANPRVLPLPVRFFDPEQTEIDLHLTSNVPQESLGYRGIRILEIDDTWYRKFITGIEYLELKDIVIVLPMVTTIDEILRMRERLFPEWEHIGITVETPAAALQIKQLLEISDYVQIGLNDLTQYTMAWDRNVPSQERLPYDRIIEPVADLIAGVAAACTSERVPFTLGMDLRPTKSLAAQVLKLGVTSISCATSLVRPWKQAIGN